MGKINVLETSVSSKIAAGEVIERPVSVVKELVENSIDADSGKIVVEIEGGGKDLIKISDDGVGISRDDMINAFKRHATSKIHTASDIFNINTMGFRGEALASVAAVSHVNLISKTEEESVGTCFQIIGGANGDITDVPSARGCILEVRKLFFNTPARLNFLKSNSHEASRITGLVTRMAMGHPQISFKLINDGTEVFYSSGNGDLREAIAKVHGVNIAKHMIYIETEFEQGNIYGFISPPQYCRGNRTSQTFFVNRRLIKNQNLSLTLDRAYRTMLLGGRFPICTLFIDIEISQIDVNVHPAKTEIKFQKEKDVQKALFTAVTSGLKGDCLVPDKDIGTAFFFDVSDKREETVNNETFLGNEYFPSGNDNLLPGIPAADNASFFQKEVQDSVKVYESYAAPEVSRIPKIEADKAILKSTNIVGQMFNTYIVVQGDSEFYIIDQHAAHEKILYEQFSGDYNLIPATQELVSPYPVEISPEEMSLVEEYEDDFEKMGFNISVFGRNTVLVRSVPYYFNKIVDPAALKDIIDHIEDPEYVALDTKGKLVASMACHTAIKAGDKLSQTEMEELIVKLNTLKNPYTCPHGRPVIISTSLKDLERKFLRVL